MVKGCIALLKVNKLKSQLILKGVRLGIICTSLTLFTKSNMLLNQRICKFDLDPLICYLVLIQTGGQLVHYCGHIFRGASFNTLKRWLKGDFLLWLIV